MSEITLKGLPVNTSGDLPDIGSNAPGFDLVDSNLSVVSLDNFIGKNVILNVFPSIDTVICASSVKEFNKEASNLPNTVVLCVSMDLPFAHKRFCEAMNLQHIIPLSDFRNRAFGRNYGLTIVDGPLAGLLARAVIVLDTKHTVIHQQLVTEISEPPDYQAALSALSN